MAINSLNFLSEHPSGIGLGTQGSGNMLSVKDNRLNTDNYFSGSPLRLVLLA